MTSKTAPEILWSLDMPMEQFFLLSSDRLTKTFALYLQNVPALNLKQPMEYALVNTGKRLRPLLIYATGTIFNAPLINLDIPAAAVELVHTYSLLHDDLPCMDNADFRRGKPASHKVFGEAAAVLTGDALHTLAMQILAGHPGPLNAERRVEMMKKLAQACGPFGMAAGQAMDIMITNDHPISSALLEEIYLLKTGKLIAACIELGLLASQHSNESDQQALKKFGELIGLAFQVQDDILDVESTYEKLGKSQGMDNKNNKINYVKLHGLDYAKEKVEALYQEALATINYFGHAANLLRQLTDHMLRRES